MDLVICVGEKMLIHSQENFLHVHSLCFISNVANFELVSGFQFYTVVACVGCLASLLDTSPVACITFKIIKFMT